MDKSLKGENDDEDEEDNHKPTAQEKRQAGDVQDTSDSDANKPMKKKRKKESFSLGCKVLCQHIEFDDGELVYINKQKLQSKVQEAHQRLAELDALRREYQCTMMHMKIYITGTKMTMG